MLFVEKLKHLDTGERASVIAVVLKRRKLWIRDDEFPEPLKDYPKIKITLKGEPVAIPRRPMSDEKESAAEATTQSWTEWGIARKSRSPWATNPVMVKKKNGKWR